MNFKYKYENIEVKYTDKSGEAKPWNSHLGLGVQFRSNCGTAGLG